MGISNVISLFSGIALFLFGMALMGDGLKQVAGNKLELILYRLTGSPVKGFLLGTGVTAVIQSSSATSVMVVGFVNSGMMKVRQSISIVLGAILGTSITGWIICLSDIGSTGGWMDLFSTATLTGVISVIGIVLRMASKDPAKKHIGDILMGFAVLMFGMSTMSAAVSPLREDPTFIRILTSFSNPFLGILFGTLFTCVLQSASAAVGILQALAIEQSRLTINAMAEEAKRNFVEAVALLHGFSDERYKLVEDLEKSVDRYEDKLGTYLVKVTEREMTVRQNAEVSKFLHTLSDFERISDHALNIAEGAKELHEKNLSFSDAAAHELEVVEAALTEILSTAIRSFVNNDLQLAARVEPLEELIDNLCDELKLHHVDRLQKGLCTLGQGFVFNDLLTNYERVADHCSNIAVAMIELESDSFDTHEYLNSVKEMKSDTFARYYEEYSRIYQI